jgi:DNA-binding HxlR family transcriptional regulator
MCSVARTLDIVGEKWALLAVREVFLGNRRFDEMIRRTGAPRDTLAARLRTLVAAGILERRQYSEHPGRFEYRLAPAGRELYPVILTLMRWGDRHLAGDDGPPMILEHNCGHRLVAQVVCEACGQRADARDTTPVAAHPGRAGVPSGPGSVSLRLDGLRGGPPAGSHLLKDAGPLADE